MWDTGRSGKKQGVTVSPLAPGPDHPLHLSRQAEGEAAREHGDDNTAPDVHPLATWTWTSSLHPKAQS